MRLEPLSSGDRAGDRAYKIKNTGNFRRWFVFVDVTGKRSFWIQDFRLRLQQVQAPQWSPFAQSLHIPNIVHLLAIRISVYGDPKAVNFGPAVSLGIRQTSLFLAGRYGGFLICAFARVSRYTTAF